MGGPSSGKTTLYSALESKYVNNPEIAFAEEQARKFFEESDIPLEKRESPEVQRALQDRILANERSVSLTNPRAIVADRTVLDPAVYSFSGGHKEESRHLLDRVEPWLPTYSYLYVLDIHDIEHVNDSVRYEDEAHRERIHEAYLGFLTLHNINYEILTGTVAQRFHVVQAVLE